MGAVSKIAWTHSTFNPWIGCQRVSPGCENCYAEGLDKRARYGGATNWGARAPRYGTTESYWRGPTKWNTEAAAAGERRRVFCGSMCDWLEPRPDLVERRLRLCRQVIPATPWLDWLLLTKRPENAVKLVPRPWLDGDWPRNAWFGFTAEDQNHFDRRWPTVRHLPAPLIWCSYEPALGPIDFDDAIDPQCECRLHPEPAVGPHDEACPRGGSRLSWVIFGGESGAGARPCSLSWGRAVRDQCAAAGVAFFCKQAGARPLVDPLPGLDDPARRIRLPLVLDPRAGTVMDEWPPDLRIRQFPASARATRSLPIARPEVR